MKKLLDKKTGKGHHYAPKYRTPFSKKKRELQMKHGLQIFFENVLFIPIPEIKPNVIFKCSGMYLSHDNQADIVNRNHFLPTELDKENAVYHCVFAYFFHKYGIKVHITKECCGEYIFCFYDAYLKGEKKK